MGIYQTHLQYSRTFWQCWTPNTLIFSRFMHFSFPNNYIPPLHSLQARDIHRFHLHLHLFFREFHLKIFASHGKHRKQHDLKADRTDGRPISIHALGFSCFRFRLPASFCHETCICHQFGSKGSKWIQASLSRRHLNIAYNPQISDHSMSETCQISNDACVIYSIMLQVGPSHQIST